MVNPRFSKPLTELRGKEFFQLVKRIEKMRPEGMKMPPAVLRADPGCRVKDEDMPFGAGDRVQILEKGSDHLKVGWILGRYPSLGNAFYVSGVGVHKSVNPVETRRPDVEDDGWEPVMSNYKVFDYNDLRLVTKIKDGDRDVDVAIHSIALGPERYDSFSNTHRRIRFAENDRAIEIPWPALERPQRVAEEKQYLATAPEVADARTHFVVSARDCPLPEGLIRQVTNLDSKYKRARYAKRLSAEVIQKAQPPSMPIPPQSQKLLDEIAKLPKPSPALWTPEVAKYLDGELRKGLHRRVDLEKQNFDSYK